jgi:hypothetical protein
MGEFELMNLMIWGAKKKFYVFKAFAYEQKANAKFSFITKIRTLALKSHPDILGRMTS